jgi:DNA-binding NtrC family response regulator
MKRRDENRTGDDAPEPPKALIVDDEPDFRDSLRALVEREGFEVETAGTLREARSRLAERTPDLVLVDIKLPDGDGLDLVRDEEVAARSELVVVTGHASVDSAVEVLRAGSLDYLTKPLDRGRLKSVLTNVARTRALKEEVSHLRGELRELGRCGRLVGRSKPMQTVYDLIERVAQTDATVLVSGESGTGKELAAETIHQLSPRRKAPFLPLNCSAVSPNLIESELFGHERGSFTGADRQRKGYFEQASRGTLFLDEITEMPAELQVKLLRVLETGAFMRVGGTEPIQVDVRVIAATNRNPLEAVEEGKLRDDLYYRLNVFPIALPPLRSRDSDIAYLADHFLEELNRDLGETKRWSRAALNRLRAQPWPGNVRELKNAVHRAFILSEDEIGPDAIPESDAELLQQSGDVLNVRVGSSIEEVERRLILATLEELGGDKRKAAKTLGLSLKTLYNRLNVYNAGSGGR